MEYSFSQDVLNGVFMIPTQLVDKYLKLASPIQLKVILSVFRNLSEPIDPSKFAKKLGCDESDVCDALQFWVSTGILVGERAEKAEEKIQFVPPKAEKPSREEVIKRYTEDKNVALIMQEAQMYFKGSLSQNVSSFLLYLYDDCRFEPSVILYMLSYASRQGKCSLPFIKNLSNDWIEHEVRTVQDAEARITDITKEDLAWDIVRKTFGIEKRKPSENEKKLSLKWINEWEITPELLKQAYDICVDKKSKLIFSYIAAIIEAWHKQGVKRPDDIKAEDAKPVKKSNAKYDYAGYDLEKFMNMINDDD